jgi:hypothetical protein
VLVGAISVGLVASLWLDIGVIIRANAAGVTAQ